MAKKRYTKDQIRNALREARGFKIRACEILGCDFHTIQRYITDDTESQSIITFYRRRRYERSLFKLDEAIERGENWAIALEIKNGREGRLEGYGDSVDVTSGGGALKVIIEYSQDTNTTTPSNTSND